ncbi:MAG TPA: HAD-IIA family hydrolase [Aggregatilineales bacterium]|nr:HAD-IIA family hydrolase [Anaerolineales bacterium]HRE48076.1 HAD-IIA family hydrolase [Aggregatilineales bacterium]
MPDFIPETPFDFSTIRAVALDLDGVVWRGEIALPGTPSFFHALAKEGIPYLFLTNNAMRNPDDHAAKIATFGIPVTPSQVINSGFVAAESLAKQYPIGTAIHVLGSENLSRLLTERGFVLNPAEAAVVVVGLDVQVTYEKLKIAGRCILNGAVFIGTNGDVTYPAADGVAPGAGSLIAALSAMTGCAPLLMGKPAPAMFEIALQRLGTAPQETLMIGDRLDTDILGAAQVGMRTALVLSGISTRAEAEASQPPPDWIGDDLIAVGRAWGIG